MGRTDFDRLLDRYIKGEVTEEERKKMDAWLDVVKTKDELDFEFTKEDEARLLEKITSNLHHVEEVIALADEVEKKNKPFFSSWAMIASVTFVVVAITYMGYLVKNKFDVIDEVVLDTNDQMILHDGTIVWLTKGSTLSYYQDAGVRHAALDGEALFEVAKDATHPFIIHHGDINIRVVGTSFSLRTEQNRITLKVLTGKVNLTSAFDSIGVDILPNEKIIYAENGLKEKSSLTTDERTTIVEDTGYNMDFKNTALEIVFARIEKKFKVRLNLQTPGLARCHITANYTDFSLEQTFVMLSEILDLKYVIGNGTVTVYGQECKKL